MKRAVVTGEKSGRENESLLPSARELLPTTEAGTVVSLLVCTYNRGSLLGRTLASLLDQRFGWGEFEVIVVDNASTDDTRLVAEEYCKRDARVRYIYEARLGVAIARNTGARAARSPYIAYFDDDLIAAPDCLHNLISPFFQVHPPPAAVMGRVELEWEGKRPAWFPRSYETLLSAFDQGKEARFMTPDEYLITMNVAFEREAFLAAGGIREDLSRKGRMLICSGDNEVFTRYMKDGLSIYYEPDALIWHYVPRARQTRQWLHKRLFGEGASQVLVDYAVSRRRPLMRRTLYDSKVALELCAVSVGARLRGKRAAREYASLRLVHQLGRISAELQLLAGFKNVKTVSE